MGTLGRPAARAPINTSDIPDGIITTAKIGASQITTAKLAADAVDGTKLADNAVDSEHITAAGIDTTHLGNLQITAAKVAADVATQAEINLKAPLASPTFTGTPLTTTASAATNTTQIASTAYVRTEVSNLVASAPSALDTLNELAAALGDDAAFSTTVTNSIATKLPLAGGTMTGNIVMGDDTSIGISDAAERIEFDADGHISILGANLGVGTSDPKDTLHVYGTGGWEPQVVIENAGVHTTPAQLQFYKSRAGGVGVSGDYLGQISFQGDDDTSATDTTYANIFAVMDDAAAASKDGSIHFMTMVANTETEMFTIKGGKVGIGEVAPGYALEVKTGTDPPSNIGFKVNGIAQAAGDRTRIAIGDGAGNSAYISAQQTNSIALLHLEAGGNDILTCTHQGRVGVNTTIPTSSFEVWGTTNTTLSINRGGASSGETGVFFKNDAGTPGADSISGALVCNNGNDLLIRAGGNSTKMTVYSTGRIAINMAVDSTARTMLLKDLGASGDSTSRYPFLIQKKSDTNNVCWFRGDGRLWIAQNIDENSDKNTKENISYISTAIDIVNDLKPATFDRNEEYGGSKDHAGFIVQDVETVLPHAVSGGVPETNNMKSIHYNHFIPYLTKAIQELSAKVAALEAA